MYITDNKNVVNLLKNFFLEFLQNFTVKITLIFYSAQLSVPYMYLQIFGKPVLFE